MLECKARRAACHRQESSKQTALCWHRGYNPPFWKRGKRAAVKYPWNNGGRGREELLKGKKSEMKMTDNVNRRDSNLSRSFKFSLFLFVFFFWFVCVF